MSNVKKLIIICFYILFYNLTPISPVFAESRPCNIKKLTDDLNNSTQPISKNTKYIHYEIEVDDSAKEYKVYTDGGLRFAGLTTGDYNSKVGKPNNYIITDNITNDFANTNAFLALNEPVAALAPEHNISVEKKSLISDDYFPYCTSKPAYRIYIFPTPTPQYNASCSLDVSSNVDSNNGKYFTQQSELFAQGKIITNYYIKPLIKFGTYQRSQYDISYGPEIQVYNVDTKQLIRSFKINNSDVKTSDSISIAFTTYLEHMDEGKYVAQTKNLYVYEENFFGNEKLSSEIICESYPFTIDKNGGFIVTATPTPIPPTPPDICFDRDSQCNVCAPGCEACPWCKAKITKIPTPPYPSLQPLCDQLAPGELRNTCSDCINGKNDTGKNPGNKRGIWSAVGCLPTDFSTILSDYVFKYGAGIAGGIAFLYFIYGCFLILTSAGNPEKLEEAKQIILSSLSGLFLVIFSIFLLKVIGVDILKLPGFG